MALIRRIVRAPLALVPKRMVLPVLTGPLRGARWIAGAGPHGCWLGTYEGQKPRLMASLLACGDCVFDIGANAGYYTLLASRLVGASGSVVAFEPLPLNLALLREHVRLNRSDNVVVVPAAVSDRAGEVRFSVGASPLMGRISDVGEITVAAVTVDEMVQSGEVRPPRLIKIDVEGAEESVLAGAAETLRRFRPVILLAGHGTAVQRRCVSFLESCGYKLDETNCGDGAYESLAVPQ